MLRLDLDSYKEILDTITRNKMRSFLTGFGVFWGVFMLLLLTGGGSGLKEMFNAMFNGFATNSAIIIPSATSKSYKGFNKGRVYSLTYKDISRLRESVPQLDAITPVLYAQSSGTIAYNDRKANGSVQGTTPDYSKVSPPKIYYGRFINAVDIKEQRKVCVIGKKIYQNLFGTGNPCGKRIKIDSYFYEVVGVDFCATGASLGGNPSETVILPITLMQKVYNRGNSVDIIALTARGNTQMTSLIPNIRNVIAQSHTFDVNDEEALMILNTEVMFSIMDNLFKGINMLIWLIGLGTLMAGAVGVSNIMMVTVRERTTEIGIRRAIGATPRNILTQIISESIVLTIVAGMSGIIFAVAILEMVELGMTTDGILAAHFQVNFWTAIVAALIISTLGVLAGLAPAWRAMSIKPVDAMRDE